MTTFAIGAATVTRIEETYEPNFAAAKFFPDWRSECERSARTPAAVTCPQCHAENRDGLRFARTAAAA